MKIPPKIRRERLRKKHLRRKLKRMKKRKRSRAIIRHRNMGWGGTSPVLDLLRHSMHGKNLAIWEPAERAWTIKIPSIFSFARNWNETVNVLYSVVEVSKLRKIRSLVFDQSACVDMGLGASVVLDVITLELRREWIASGQKYYLRGYYPKDKHVEQQVRCTGLTKHLKVRGAEASPDVEDQYLRTELMVGSGLTASRLNGSSDQEAKATDLALHLDNCFRKAAGYRLTRYGKKQIVRWAGELITNAEEHSGRNEWYAMSFMRPVDNPPAPDGTTPVYECNLVIFAFGRSIFESMNNPQTPEETRGQIEELATELSKKGWLGRARAFDTEDLTTLYAMQDGVSRHNQSPGVGTTVRGSGTITMIDAFQKIGDSERPSLNPGMVLISGGTRLYFTKDFSLQPDAHGRKIIAFNPENDLRQRPDPAHVHSLQGFFPGTISSFRFYIDKSHLDGFIVPVLGKDTAHV